jgi:glucoamylase
VHDANTRDTEAGLHVADLPTAAFGAGVRVLSTFFWPQADRWEGQDFAVAVNAR